MDAILEKSNPFKGNGTPIPKPQDDVELYSIGGHILHKERSSIMGRLNEKKEVTGAALWLIGIAPAFLAVALSYGASWIIQVRENETEKASKILINYKLDEQAHANERIEGELREMNKGYQEMRELKIKLETAEKLLNRK